MSSRPNNKRYRQENGWVIGRDERKYPRLSEESTEDIIIRYRVTPPVGHPKFKQWENGTVSAVTSFEVRNDGDGWYVHPGSSTDNIDPQEAKTRAAALHMAANECIALIEEEKK